MTARVVIATLAIALVVGASTYTWLRMPLSVPLPDGAGARALAFVRATLEHRTPPALNDDSDQRGLPVIVSLFDGGQSVARAIGHGDTFDAAVRDAALHLDIEPAVLARGRLKLDRVVGRGHLVRTIAPMLALGTVPARDGIGAERGTSTAWITADELLRQGAWGRYVPVPSMDFSFGLDPARTLRQLSNVLDGKPDRIFRFRAEEYVETVHHGIEPVVAGRVPGAALTKENVLAAARAGAAYLLAHIDGEGRFDYEYYTVEDSRIATNAYSLPRHAGAASFLALLYEADHDMKVREALERALDYLVRQRPPGCDGDRICIGHSDEMVELGSVAIALVATSHYARATGDARYDSFAAGLVRFILSMQKADGEFCHLFTPSTHERDEHTQLLYYSGEAAYGLGLWLQHHDDPQARDALDHSLTYLTDTQYANLAGQFYVGEDHWTCMAVDAGWDALPPAHRDRYARFCDAFAQFMRKTQMLPGDSIVTAQPQLAGAYGVSAAMAPHNTPVGSRSESIISIWHIAKRRGLDDGDRRVRDPRDQVEEGMRYLLANQIGEDSYLMTNLAASQGGWLMSDSERHIRIDFVQHAGCSLLRSLELGY